MNLRGKLQREQTYKEYLEKHQDNLNGICRILGYPEDVNLMLPCYIMDFIVDTKDSLEKKLNVKLSWPEYDILYKELFSGLAKKLSTSKQFNGLSIGEKDILVYIQLGKILEIEVPDRFLADILKNSRKDNDQCTKEEKEEIDQKKEKVEDIINELANGHIKTNDTWTDMAEKWINGHAYM